MLRCSLKGRINPTAGLCYIIIVSITCHFSELTTYIVHTDVLYDSQTLLEGRFQHTAHYLHTLGTHRLFQEKENENVHWHRIRGREAHTV